MMMMTMMVSCISSSNRRRERRTSREARSKFIEQVRQEDWDRRLRRSRKNTCVRCDCRRWSRCITDAIATAAAAPTANDQETDIVRYDLQMRLGFCSFALTAVVVDRRGGCAHLRADRSTGGRDTCIRMEKGCTFAIKFDDTFQMGGKNGFAYIPRRPASRGMYDYALKAIILISAVASGFLSVGSRVERRCRCL